MYQSYKAQLLNAQKEATTDKYIGNEITQMLRNQMLMQGITPITIEREQPSISEERDYIISRIKTITTEPSKFYDYLYKSGQIADFSLGVDEFIKKKLRYKRNLPYNSLIKEWEDYKTGELSVTPLDVIRKNLYGKIVEPRIRLNKQEEEQRKAIEQEEYENRDRKQDLYKIDTELINLKRGPPKAPPPPPVPKKLKIPESNLLPLSPIDKLMDELKEKIQSRKIEGIGIKKRKNMVNVINNKVIYRWDWR
jgi:hypothetical protein